VLEAMRRRYTRDSYLELIAQIRESLPDVALSTDMIVGFPEETDADFEDTLTLTAAVRYHSMFSFKYSPRPNTLADKRLQDNVGETDKTRRIVTLQALRQRNTVGIERGDGRTDRRRSGGRGQSTTRGRTLGRTSTNVAVNLPGAGGMDRPDTPGPDRARRPAQRVGKGHGPGHRRAGVVAPCKSK
jgi:tRNA-2-methylthio-N6-dimethylallyladenosine synthase